MEKWWALSLSSSFLSFLIDSELSVLSGIETTLKAHVPFKTSLAWGHPSLSLFPSLGGFMNYFF